MENRTHEGGFTLIELMIVVAIIAIIAAIAIPSILRSRISANEASVRGSLDSVVKANQLFRQNDSEGNGVNDYWTADVFGLWGVLTASGGRLELIPGTVAGADYQYNSSSPSLSYSSSVDVWGTSPVGAGQPSSKSGYYFGMMDGEYSAGSTSGSCSQQYNDSQSYSDMTDYALTAFPESYDSSGRNAFMVVAGGHLFRIDATETDNGMGSAFNDSSTGEVTSNPGTLPNSCVPNQKQLSRTWSAQ